MRLLELHIDGFGKFHDQTISFEDGINVIYGNNEAGKSTLHTFIRGMLFGIERGRGRAAKNDLYTKYEPWENSGTYEGWIRLEKNGTIYRLERRFRIRGMRDPDISFDLEFLSGQWNIIEILDETEPQYDFHALFAEHSSDMIGFYIQALMKDDMSPVEKKALYYGIHALLMTKDERSQP